MVNRITSVGTGYLLFILPKKSCENTVLLDQKLSHTRIVNYSRLWCTAFPENDTWEPYLKQTSG